MNKPKIILFYNTMWGEPLDYPGDEIPDTFVITTERRFMDEAAAVVFHLPSLPPDLLAGGGPGKKGGQLWVAWSMECEAHFPHLTDPLFMSRFDLIMSYRLDADVVVPYVSSCFGELLRKPAPSKEPGSIVNAFISSPNDKSGRVVYLMRMMSALDIHSYGKLIRNRTAADDNGRPFRMDTISRYKFTLAFENAVARDYVTEKFYDPLITGSVPVYLGAPNISDFAPGEDCFINASEWEDPESLARYLLDVSRDDGLYASYFEWKKRPFLPEFTRLLELQKVHPFVRLCGRVGEIIKS